MVNVSANVKENNLMLALDGGSGINCYRKAGTASRWKSWVQIVLARPGMAPGWRLWAQIVLGRPGIVSKTRGSDCGVDGEEELCMSESLWVHRWGCQPDRCGYCAPNVSIRNLASLRGQEGSYGSLDMEEWPELDGGPLNSVGKTKTNQCKGQCEPSFRPSRFHMSLKQLTWPGCLHQPGTCSAFMCTVSSHF